MTGKQFPTKTLKKQEINWCTFSEAHPPHVFWYSENFHFINNLTQLYWNKAILMWAVLIKLKKNFMFQIIPKIVNSIY